MEKNMEVLPTDISELHRIIRELYRVIDVQQAQIKEQKIQYKALEEKYFALEKKHLALEKNYSTLEKNYSALEKKYSALEKKYSALEEKYQTLEEKYTVLLHRHQRQRFGKSSERQTTPKLNLSDEPKNKGKKGRKKLPETLEREIVEYDLPELEQYCPHCQAKLSLMGMMKSEQLDQEPMQLKVIEHVQKKYACRQCGMTVKLAEKPETPIAKGIATSGLLSQIILNKYADALPLYRQEKIFERHGTYLPRSTLCDWVSESGLLLKRLVQVARLEIKKCERLHTDDTPVPVLDRTKRGKTHTGRLWVYIGCQTGEKPIIIYEYTKTRSQEGPVNFLKNYTGFLQADAYAGYDAVYETGTVWEVACWAHARRKFYDIMTANPNSKKAKEVIDTIALLYQIEKEIKHLSNKERRKIRQEKSLPILKTFKKRLKSWSKETLPKGPLGLAIQYVLKLWKALTIYCKHGCLEIDNNRAERAIKPVVLGRKNYLFAGSHQGAETAATIYSLIESCKANEVNPYDYFTDVLTRLPNCKVNQVHELLPWRWKKSPPEVLVEAA